MRRFIAWAALSALVAVLALPDPAAGGWGAGGCGPVGPSFFPFAQAPFPVRPGTYGKKRKPKPKPKAKKAVPKCGCCDECGCKKGKCACGVKKHCSEGCKCCVAKCPCDKGGEGLPEPVFGVVTEKVHAGERSIMGRPVTRRQAFEAVEKGVPDDEKKPHLTVIDADKATRDKVVADLAAAPELAPWKDKYRVQAYAPSEWAVAGAGFPTDGHPRIVVQDDNGDVVHSQGDYADGPGGLAKGLRKADPNYDPKADPDLRKPRLPIPLPFDFPNLPWSYLVLGGAALFVLTRRKP